RLSSVIPPADAVQPQRMFQDHSLCGPSLYGSRRVEERAARDVVWNGNGPIPGRPGAQAPRVAAARWRCEARTATGPAPRLPDAGPVSFRRRTDRALPHDRGGAVAEQLEEEEEGEWSQEEEDPVECRRRVGPGFEEVPEVLEEIAEGALLRGTDSRLLYAHPDHCPGEQLTEEDGEKGED